MLERTWRVCSGELGVKLYARSKQFRTTKYKQKIHLFIVSPKLAYFILLGDWSNTTTPLSFGVAHSSGAFTVMHAGLLHLRGLGSCMLVSCI